MARKTRRGLNASQPCPADGIRGVPGIVSEVFILIFVLSGSMSVSAKIADFAVISFFVFIFRKK